VEIVRLGVGENNYIKSQIEYLGAYAPSTIGQRWKPGMPNAEDKQDLGKEENETERAYLPLK
jgi:hypothetical protein